MKRSATALRRALLAFPLIGPTVRKISGAVDRAPAHSLLGRLGPLRTVLRPSATGDQVLAILDILDEAGIRCWVAGGWGVDALVGHQTRRHGDVDVVLDEFEHAIERATIALGAHGFKVLERDRLPTWMPDRWHLADGLDCHVELVSLDLVRVQRAFSLEGATGRDALASFGMGTIAGRAVPCLSAEAQRIVHGGFHPRRTDRDDLTLLTKLSNRRADATSRS